MLWAFSPASSGAGHAQVRLPGCPSALAGLIHAVTVIDELTDRDACREGRQAADMVSVEM